MGLRADRFFHLFVAAVILGISIALVAAVTGAL